MTAAAADLVAQIAEAVRAEQLATIEELGRDAMLWLVAAPLWTRDAAERAGFPARPVTGFVKRARAEGWCETRGSLRGDGDPGLSFWVPDDLRRDVLNLLSQGDSRQRLINEARVAAGRVEQRVLRRAAEPGTAPEVPDALGYWAQLLSDAEPDRALVDRVARAVDAGDLPMAQHMVAAGEAMEPLLAGTMALAVDRARRLLSLGSRRRQDARALHRYLDRPELSGAVGGLLRPDAAQWALHLRGMGGVGKTMLIRYLASGQYTAKRDEPGLTIARVDFDYMSPDYPVRRPVELLIALADELSLYTAADGRADRALAGFLNAARGVHESLSGKREDHSSTMRNPDVLAAVDAFADTLRLLPRPLLILDTCEELAKADAGDPAAPAVSNTLAMIKRIHDRAPDARVLLAGRRPLPGQDFLAVVPVRGFTREEAARYLKDFTSRPLPPDLVAAMIRQSPAVDEPPPAPGQPPSRVSPFDLALYREWADEDPRLDTTRVGGGSHAYIEGRIIGRLDDPAVRRALPALATAGRCRVTTLAAFLGDGADPAALGPRLAEQEWIDADGDPPVHVSAAPALAQRLRAYFGESGRSAAFTEQKARLAALLTQLVRDGSLDDVDGDELLAALRLSEPAAAAQLWDELAGRAAAEGRWTWLFNMTRLVNGESETNLWESSDALRATVLAATVAASRRVIPGFNPAATWAEVRRRAEDHPDREAAAWLRTRAILGMLARTADDEELWAALEALPTEAPFGFYAAGDRTAEVIAATADAAHQLLEAGQDTAARRLLRRVGAEWADGGIPQSDAAASPPWNPHPGAVQEALNLYQELRAWLLTAFGRALAGDDPAAARRTLEDAAAFTLTSSGQGTARSWFDAPLPADLAARVRIEQGLIDWHDDGNSQQSAWLTAAADLIAAHSPEALATVDGERSVSLSMLRWLSYVVIPVPIVRAWADADEYRPDRKASSSAHDLVPPLFVAVAEAYLAAGDPERALEHAGRHRQAALQTRDDETTIRHADAVTVRIARRTRLDDQRALLSRLAEQASAEPAAADAGPGADRLRLADDARRALAVVYREPATSQGGEVTGRAGGWHAWWQTQGLPVGPVPPVLWPAGDADTAQAADIEVDLVEFERVSPQRHQQLLAGSALADWLARPRPQPKARTAQPYRHLRAQLRQSAMGSDGLPRSHGRIRYASEAVGGEPAAQPGAGLSQVPARLLADMAFEEGELAALRLPDVAARLFERAAAACRAVSDETGYLLAELARVTTVMAAQPAGEPPDPAALERFHAAARAVPRIAEVPFYPEPAAGLARPWQYWGSRLAEVLPPVKAAPAGRPTITPPVRPWDDWGTSARPWRPKPSLTERVADFIDRLDPRELPDWLREHRPVFVMAGQVALAGVALGLAEAAAAALWVLAARLPGFGPLIAAGAAVAAFAVAVAVAARWRKGALRRLADGTAVGAALRPASLEFTVLVLPGGAADGAPVTLWAHLRSPWRLPWRQRPGLIAAAFAVLLVSAFRPRRRRRNGYRGRWQPGQASFSGQGRLTWTDGGPEQADAAWWTGPATPGLIVVRPEDAARPWERIITSGLGPDAAGHVEWRRQVFVAGVPSKRRDSGLPFGSNLIAAGHYRPHPAAGVLLDASPTWAALYGDHYKAKLVNKIQVRHAIGTAVTTSAGPRLEVAGRSAQAGGLLLGTEELGAGDPSLIIVQADPAAADEITADQGTRELLLQLEIAVDLIRAGSAPAVLLLPALPAGYTQPVAEAIARYAKATGDAASAGRPNPAALQAELRALLRPEVRPALLDDIVLFINDRE